MEVVAVGGARCDMEMCISRCSSTTTADDELGGRAWADFSPVVDWGMFVDDDFHGLIESMMACDGGEYQQDRGGCFAWDHVQGELLDAQDATPSNSGVSCGRSADVPMAAALVREGGEEPDMGDEEGEEEDEEEEEEGEREDMKGLRLVHLLMAAAEALSGENGGLDLARVILVRLKEMASPNAASNMERLAACFTDALQALLDASSVSSSSSYGGGGKHSAAQHHHKQLQMLLQQQQYQPLPGDALAAFQLLQDMSPYVKFGHFTANQAILEAVAGERRVHILDYDIMEGVQWASLIQALVSRSDGPPPPHLRITAVSRPGAGGGGASYGRRPIGTIQETGRRLAAFAASVGQSFSFAQCRLDADEGFRVAGLKLVKGEALVVNCMLHLPHSAATQRPALSVASFLSGAAALSPRLVTLVEEETGGSAGANGGFVGRFMDSLHHYSAVYDSLEAGLPMHARSRALVERVFLGPRIAGTVGRVYQASGASGDQEADISWGEWMGKMGFRKVGISFPNRCQAKLLLGLFNDGYQVEDAAANKLVLAWKSRRLLSASVWTAPSPAPPPPSTAM